MSELASNFRPEDRRAGRYIERSKLVALKALAEWLAEKRLYYEQRGDQCAPTKSDASSSRT